jgi:hypothetical protein
MRPPILIDGDAELLRARAPVDQLWNSTHLGDLARLEAQARLVAAYEEMKWPRRPPSVTDLIRHLMDQHGLTRVAPPPKKPPPRPTREASPGGGIDVEGGSASTDPDRCPGGRKSGPLASTS